MTLSCTIIFDPFGRRVSVPVGTTLFQAALSKGILLRSDCGEKGTCGKCRVIVDHPDHLSPRTEQEQKLLKKEGRITAWHARPASSKAPPGNSPGKSGPGR